MESQRSFSWQLCVCGGGSYGGTDYGLGNGGEVDTVLSGLSFLLSLDLAKSLPHLVI